MCLSRLVAAMMPIFWLLIVLGLGHCWANDVPSSAEIENSINRTILEVERMVREDPKLPRLSRKEIVNILHNITSKELELYKDQNNLEKAREMYQRALMVVLPYNAQNTSDDLSDLYTKPPMTQIVPDVANADKIEPDADDKRSSTVPSANDTFAVSNNISDHTVSPALDNQLGSRVSYKSAAKESQTTTMRNRYKNHRDTYSEIHTKVPLKQTLKLDSAPVRFTFNLQNLRNSYSTDKPIAITRRPVYRKETTGSEMADESKLEIVYSTSVMMESTTREPAKDTSIDLTDLNTDHDVLTSDQWRYNAPPTTTPKPEAVSKIGKNREKLPVQTTVKIAAEDAMTVDPPKKTEFLKKLPKTTTESTLFLDADQPMTLFVTPMSSGTSPKSKYSSTYSLNSGGFRTATAAPMRPEVMDLLASIGLRPKNSSNVEDIYKNNKELLESKSQIPGTDTGSRTTSSGLTSGDSNAASIVGQNTFESAEASIKKAVQNLTPDVQLLFQKFGLQPSNLDEPITTTTAASTANSYTNFKPLPSSNVRNQEMREFLAKFGLGVNDNRREKAMRTTPGPPSLIEAVPNNMRGILENIGLITNSRKVPKTVPKAPEDMELTETNKFHVFKPYEVNLKDESQRMRINELLDTVKQVQEGKADVQDVQKAAKDLIRSTKTLKDGPDPVSLEEILRIYNEDVKNEVKRQEQGTPEATSGPSPAGDNATLTETIDTTTPGNSATDSSRAASDLTGSTTTEEPLEFSLPTPSSTASSNLVALEESFGGTTREPDPVVPPRRKSGLYFLVDWNTFLEVGEGETDKVNLRFQPKVGDRTRFLPVTVP